MIPKDPVILLSFLNTQLRDSGEDFQEVCKRLMVDRDAIQQKLSSIGYEYDDRMNQFK